jgi:hypothetical protein
MIEKLYNGENIFVRAENVIQTYGEQLILEGKERMRLGGQGIKQEEKFDKLRIMSKSVEISHDTLSKVDYILNSKDEDVIRKVREGLISVNKAHNMVKGTVVSHLPTLGDRHRVLKNWNVFFIHQKNGGPIKIGKTKSVQLKLNQLQAGNPDPLEILRIIYDVSDKKKNEIEKQFEEYKMGDGWYKEDIYPLIWDIK